MKMYYYKAYGLAICSEMEFTELMPTESSGREFDCFIKISKVPSDLQLPVLMELPVAKANKGEFLFNIPKIARYYVRNGIEIIVEPYPNSDESSVRLFLLSNAFAALLFQKKHLPFHASAIEVNGRLTLFMGHSGAGKSSLITDLWRKGYKVFSDDVIVLKDFYLEDRNTTFSVHASYPMIKLWKSSIEKIDDVRLENRHLIRKGVMKYGIHFHEEFVLNPLPIEKIAILNPKSETREYSCRQLRGMELMKKLRENIYRERFIVEQNTRKKVFKILQELALQVPVIEVSRHQKGSSINDFSNYIEENIIH